MQGPSPALCFTPHPKCSHDNGEVVGAFQRDSGCCYVKCQSTDTLIPLVSPECLVREKTPWQVPAGLLQPLPDPHRPWSHISLDFVMGLPPSEGNTATLTVVPLFSKAAHFIPLPKLPSAKETASLWCSTSSGSTDSRWTWSPTGVRSSCPGSGRHSASSLGRRSACPPDSTTSPTASRSEPNRT